MNLALIWNMSSAWIAGSLRLERLSPIMARMAEKTRSAAAEEDGVDRRVRAAAHSSLSLLRSGPMMR